MRDDHYGRLYGSLLAPDVVSPDAAISVLNRRQSNKAIERFLKELSAIKD